MLRILKEVKDNRLISYIAKLLLTFFVVNIFSISSFATTKMVPPIETSIPFVGVLLSIALCPLLIPKLWHKFENLILASWILISIWLCIISIGGHNTTSIISNVLIKEYIPFIILVGTLFIISNGIKIKIYKEGTTMVNIAILVIGEILANFIGTTGTSILLLRPLLEVNKNRKYKVHTVIFFIFLVSNIGGCLLPFGDPPLFLGYLKGVDFFWTLKHLWPMFLIASSILIMIYAIIDKFLIKKEKFIVNLDEKTKNKTVQIKGLLNIFFMIMVIFVVAGTGLLNKNIAFNIFNTNVHYKNILRDFGLIILSIFSFIQFLYLNKNSEHKVKFSWGPISEVARYFIAIFITMAPVAIMLKSGHDFFDPIRNMLANNENPSFMYFWFVSPFSAFLDNAPTYIVFFKMAGGDANTLMHSGMKILMAISASSVFMGSMTYIGNAPNFMVRSIAKQHGVKMPGFLGYMLWSFIILLPVFALISYIFFY